MQSQPITTDLFVNPGVNLKPGDNEYRTAANLSKDRLRQRWKSQAGISIIDRWRANGFDRKVLDSLVGKFYDHTDLRGISLAGEDLNSSDLSDVDFYGSNLQNANLRATNLSNSYLSESNIRGTCFDFAQMPNVLIDNTDFDNKTSFTGVNLSAINFTLAVLLQESALDQQRIANLEKKHPVL